MCMRGELRRIQLLKYMKKMWRIFLKSKLYGGMLYFNLDDALKMVSMLDLILVSAGHKDMLLKVLPEGYVDKEIST